MGINFQNGTYLQIVEAFANIARNHGQINSFREGQLYDFDVTTVENYPLMFLEVQPAVFPLNSYQTFNSVRQTVQITIGDLVNPDEDNTAEVHSNIRSIFWDVLRIATDVYQLAALADVQLKPFVQFKDDGVSGWQADFTFTIPMTFGWCDAPFKSCIPGNNYSYGSNGSDCGDNCISNLHYENSTTIDFSGNGAVCSPLIGNVNVSARSGNTLLVLDDGLYTSGGTGVPSIPTGLIAFGSSGNTLTTDPNFEWNGDDLIIVGGLNINDSSGAILEFEDGGLFVSTESYLFKLVELGGFFTTAPFTITNNFAIEGGNFSCFGGTFTLDGGNCLLGTQTDNGYQLQVNGALTLAPITLPTTPVNGALETDGTNLYFSVGGVRQQIQFV
jgi:hypothetical protein